VPNAKQEHEAPGLASSVQPNSAHLLILPDCRAIRVAMIKWSRKVNFSHMTRFGWAVEGVAR
jgi:hypothetical protein